MSVWRLLARSIRHYFQTGVLVSAAVAIATAAMTGSLVVGTSVTGSLRDTALARLGHVDYALAAPRYFRASLARALQQSDASAGIRRVVPVILTEAPVSDSESGATLPRATVVGVEPEFWRLFASGEAPRIRDGEAVLSAALARDLGVRQGGAVVVNLTRAGTGRFGVLFAPRARERVIRSARLEVAGVLPDAGAGAFSLSPHPGTPRNLFVPRAWLAREVGRPGSANAVLVEARPGYPLTHALTQAVREAATPADFGLRLTVHPDRRTLSLESDEFLLPDGVVRAAKAAAAECGARAAAVSVHLAATLRSVRHPSRSAAYAMVASVEDAAPFRFLAGGGRLDRGGVWLNQWVAEDLGTSVGDRVELATLVPSWEGTYREEAHTFVVRGIVAMEGLGADPGLVPAIPGVTDAHRVDAWQAPFPVDLSRVTPRDEAYWERYRAAPKVFVSPETARAWWQRTSPEGETDWVTGVRIVPGGAEPSLGALARRLERAIAARLRPADAGLIFRPVREEAVQAAQGATSFAHLFLGMSGFLIAAAAGLAGVTLRLLADRRAMEAGVLLACGFPPRLVRRILWSEGMLLAAIGAVAGVLLGTVYAAALLRGLSTRWVGAVGTPTLWLHTDTRTLLAGGLLGLGDGLVAVAWGTRRVAARPVLELLGGWQAADLAASLRPARWPRLLLWPALGGAAVLLALGGAGVISSAGAFFGGGALMLAGGLCAGHRLLHRALTHRSALPSPGSVALRSAGANRGRSLLLFGLFASASFTLMAAGAHIREGAPDVSRRNSGSGGFALRAISSLPIPYDFGTPAGRERLGFPPEDEAVLRDVTVVPFLVSPGDDVSCLNPTRPRAPRLLGVPAAMVARGGFRVAGPAARLPNPWKRLEAPGPGGAIPAFGDAESVQWTLRSGAGRRYRLTTVKGTQADVWFAGLLPGSLFAGEILVSARDFRRLFPEVSAPRYFLIATPRGREQAVAASLRRNLGELGLEVRPTQEILSDLRQVQNAYLSAFLTLGGIGMLLGTFGLVAVILRSALERRGEFAMLLAIGFRNSEVGRLLVLENGGLLLAGLACGVGCGLVAAAPALRSAESGVPWGTLALILGGMVTLGLGACAAAARAATRGPLLAALRQE